MSLPEWKSFVLQQVAYINKLSIPIGKVPTSGLDATNAKLIEDILVNSKQMVINITHNLDKEVLQRYDEIICMQNGKISGIGDYETLYSQNMYFRGLCEDFKSEI